MTGPAPAEPGTRGSAGMKRHELLAEDTLRAPPAGRHARSGLWVVLPTRVGALWGCRDTRPSARIEEP
jgi:hypothetical protein